MTTQKYGNILNYMVNYFTTTRLDNVYFALSSDIRRKILEFVSTQPLSTSKLAEKLSMSLPALYKHTQVLEESNLIKKTKQGRVTYLVLVPGSLSSADDWIRAHKQFWESNLQGLENHFNNKEQHHG